MSVCGCLTKNEVLALAPGALTYRQLNYWTAHLGLIPAHRHTRKDNRQAIDRRALDDGGSGVLMGWDRPDAERAAWIAQVVAATGMAPQHAAALHDGTLVISTSRGRFELAARPRAGAA